MNVVVDMPAGARRGPTLDRAGQNARGPYTLGMFAALGLHAAVIFGWPAPKVLMEQVEFGVEAADTSVEVSLVAAMPAEEPVEAVEPPPEPPPPVVPPPEPIPEPPPVIIPEKPPEMTLPEPVVTPPPRMAPKPKLQKPASPKPLAPARASGDGSSAVPGNDATTARASAGALGAKPDYLRNPHPSYPEDARAAGQQGTVMLHVRVDEQGKTVSVRVARSSGVASLDERARSTVANQWAFRPARAGGVPVASEVIIPIQFTLNK